MTEKTCIDVVIREVAREYIPSSLDEHRIIIDGGKEEEELNEHDSLEEEELNEYDSLSAKYFIVSSGNTSKIAECETSFSLVALRTDCCVAIHLKYFVRCDPGDETRVAKVMYYGIDPGQVLHEALKKWVHTFISGWESEFIENYPRDQQQLIYYLTELAYGRMGLRIHPVISLNQNNLIDRIRLWPMIIEVSVIGCNDDQQVRVRGELVTDEGNEAHATLYGSNILALEERVKNGVQEYFAQHVSIKQFCTEMDSEDWRAKAIAHLNEGLRPFGRKIAHLEFEGIGGEKERAIYVANLQQTIHPFQVEIPCFECEDIEPVTFAGDFQILHIAAEGWHKLQGIDFDLDRIKGYLERAMAARIRQQTKEIPSYKASRWFQEIEAALTLIARESAHTAFGIAIDVFNIHRRPTPLEIKRKEAEQKELEANLEWQKERVAMAHDVSQRLLAEMLNLESVRIQQRLKQIDQLEQELLEEIALGRTQEEFLSRLQAIEKVRDLVLNSLSSMEQSKHSFKL